MTQQPDSDVVQVSTLCARTRLLMLDRPGTRNAINGALSRALSAALRRADADPDVDVIILTGRDPAFCAGADLKELAEHGFDGSAARTDCVAELSAVTKPVIGAVNGPAITGGLELALACDFLIASTRASFADTHARVGVVPGAGLTARLPQAIGIRRARQLSLTGERLSSELAYEWGLVNEVVEHERLLARAGECAAAISAANQRVVHALGMMYDRGAEGTFADSMRLQSRTNEAWHVAPGAIGDHVS